MSGQNTRRLISIGLILVMAVIFSLTTDSFLSAGNIKNLLKDSAYIGIIALGMSFVIIGGGVDLSAGGIACVVGILCVRMSVQGVPGVFIVPAAVLLGALCGLINSIFITKVKLTEFVATLALGFIYTGLTLVFAFRERGVITSVVVPPWSSLRSFGGSISGVNSIIDGIHYITIAWIILAVVFFVLLTWTKFGLHTYSIGSHKKSAQMSGVNSDRVKMTGYIICGGCAGLAVVMQVALNGSSPLNIGSGYEFQAIAACVVGGVVLGGGKGDTLSAVIGSIFLIMLMNGLYKFGLAMSWEYILQGAVILIATAFDAVFSKITNKRLLARS